MVLRGRSEIVAHNRTVFSQNFERLFITLRTAILEVGTGADLGTAWGRTYFSAQNRMRDGTGFAPIGLYFERFVAEEGRWRISWRLFQTLYSGPADLTGTLRDQPDYGAPPAMPPLDAMSREVTGLNRPIR